MDPGVNASEESEASVHGGVSTELPDFAGFRVTRGGPRRGCVTTVPAGGVESESSVGGEGGEGGAGIGSSASSAAVILAVAKERKACNLGAGSRRCACLDKSGRADAAVSGRLCQLAHPQAASEPAAPSAAGLSHGEACSCIGSLR